MSRADDLLMDEDAKQRARNRKRRGLSTSPKRPYVQETVPELHTLTLASIRVTEYEAIRIKQQERLKRRQRRVELNQVKTPKAAQFVEAAFDRYLDDDDFSHVFRALKGHVRLMARYYYRLSCEKIAPDEWESLIWEVVAECQPNHYGTDEFFFLEKVRRRANDRANSEIRRINALKRRPGYFNTVSLEKLQEEYEDVAIDPHTPEIVFMSREMKGELLKVLTAEEYLALVMKAEGKTHREIAKALWPASSCHPQQTARLLERAIRKALPICREYAPYVVQISG